MRRAIVIAAALSTWSLAASAQAPPAAQPEASPAEDAAKFVTTIMDKFNGGDVKAWIAAQANDTLIIDEFGPHTWTGSGSAQRWLEDYMKDFEGERNHQPTGRLWQTAAGDERRDDRLYRVADDLSVRSKANEDGRAKQHDLCRQARRKGLEDHQLDLFCRGSTSAREINASSRSGGS